MSEEEVEIIKPRNDKRDYRRIVLQNNLQALLISDAETDKSAASMDVHVGCLNDPEGLEGLAHFLEHMLFYASEKYPQEGSYKKYICEHGGSTNAFTSSKHTNYYFDVNPDSFEEALDRFAQFFIKPLISDDATTREVKAVDSENQENLLSDLWRMNQLQKHLSVKDHPYHKFSTGNRETLEVRPKERGLDTRQELLKFYNENYSANRMRLVIYTKDDLDKAESLVRSNFEGIRNTNRNSVSSPGHHCDSEDIRNTNRNSISSPGMPCDSENLLRNTNRNSNSFPGKPCDSENLQILVKAVPIMQGHKLKFAWPLPRGVRDYKEASSTYLGHLIGHQGEGSLSYILKKLGWATSLSAGYFEYFFFTVNIDLTDAGQEHFEDIVALLFKYIHILQQSGPCQWIFDEFAVISDASFHYQDKIRPIDYVVKIAYNMQFYPPKDWLAGSSLPSKFNPERIQSALKELSPLNVRIFWESSKFEGLTNSKEPWYGTAYSVERLTGSTIEQWVDRAAGEDLHLPAPSVFIPTDLSLKTVSKGMKLPVLLRKTPYSRLWYKPDTAFSTPKAYVKIDVNCPFSQTSPESRVLTEIFTRLLMDYLNEYAYDAKAAGLSYEVEKTDFGFQVTVVGYNHKLSILLDKVIQRIAEFEVKPDRFAVIKELVTKEYQNKKFEQPYEQVLYYRTLILQDQTWPWSELLEVLPHLEVEHLVKFYPLMLSRIFLECYAAGNIEPKEAESMIQHLEDVFFTGPNPVSQAMFPSQYMTNRVVKLEKGIHYLYSAEGINPSDKNSALLHYIQVHQDDFKLNVTLQLLALIARQPAFHQLRSVEQLGYIVDVFRRNDSGVRGLYFLIQSNVKGPDEVDLRVESFLKMFETKLYKMPRDEFKSNVNAIIEMKLEKHKNLQEESEFYWDEISDGTFEFDGREHEAEALRQLTQKDLIDYFNKYMKVGAPLKKSLSVRVYGSTHSLQYKTDNSQTAKSNVVRIEDIRTFRRSRPLYGSFRGGLGHLKLCKIQNYPVQDQI